MFEIFFGWYYIFSLLRQWVISGRSFNKTQTLKLLQCASPWLDLSFLTLPAVTPSDSSLLRFRTSLRRRCVWYIFSAATHDLGLVSGGIVIPYSHPKTELMGWYIFRNTSKIQSEKAWEIEWLYLQRMKLYHTRLLSIADPYSPIARGPLMTFYSDAVL